MVDNLKNVFLSQNTTNNFIKTIDLPLNNLTSEQKVQLNRKGNEYFNSGKFNEAQRLFVTTGYSDGLTRCGDRYMQKGKELKALKLYWLAHNKVKSEPIIKKIADLLSIWAQKAEKE